MNNSNNLVNNPDKCIKPNKDKSIKLSKEKKLKAKISQQKVIIESLIEKVNILKKDLKRLNSSKVKRIKLSVDNLLIDSAKNDNIEENKLIENENLSKIEDKNLPIIKDEIILNDNNTTLTENAEIIDENIISNNLEKNYIAEANIKSNNLEENKIDKTLFNYDNKSSILLPHSKEDLIIFKKNSIKNDIVKNDIIKNSTKNNIVKNISNDIVKDSIKNDIVKDIIKNDILKDSNKNINEINNEDIIKTISNIKDCRELSLSEEEIKNVFKNKIKKGEFKSNCSIKQFVEYASINYEFNIQNRKIFRTKNPLRIYITTRLVKILKYLIDNVNNLELNSVCSALFLINSEIEFKHKLVVCMDFINEIEIPSKLLYIFSALFNNLGINYKLDTKNNLNNIELVKETILLIMTHQFYIDTDIYKDPIIYKYLETIKENFGLFNSNITLFQKLDILISKNNKLLLNENNKYFINNEILTKVECIKCICHVVDWEYTYNTLIVRKLDYKNNPFHTFILGMLAIQAYKIIPTNNLLNQMPVGVKEIFYEMIYLMGDCSEVSIVCYLILKHIRGDCCDNYIEINREKLGKEKVEFMESYKMY